MSRSVRTFKRAACLSVALALLPSVALSLSGQGMPAELRKEIHTLFDRHDTITRSLELTEHGYTATTESSDPAVAKVLRDHVRNMEKRLASGLMVRRWDPAFEEYVSYYDQIEHRFTATDRGLKAEVKGTTPEAVKVARNHAKAVSDFVNHGWGAHDRRHPAALGSEAPESTAGETATAEAKRGCCQPKTGESRQACGRGCGNKVKETHGQRRHRWRGGRGN
jgi:hypothetical protein